ncbi:MAG: AI-2E family transporter YdiK, partial [Acidobacteria bacterium]|nr:AI-2E family transporter YdiK [Acidobacteriota bacterium]
TVTSFRIAQAFALATIWATTIVVATWPLMRRVEGWLGKRRGAAVAVMMVVMLLVFVLPLGLAVDSVVANRETITGWIARLSEMTLPPSPAWLQKVPLVGSKIAAAWDDLAVAGTKALLDQLSPYSRDAYGWLLGRLGSFGAALAQFLLTVVIAGILYSKGEIVAGGLRQFGRRLGGDRGDEVVTLAGQSIRAVALGVVVTALVQSVLGGIGLAIAGVPFAAMLTGAIFLLCIAQLGPVLVMIPAAIWLYLTTSHGWGIALLVWAVAVGMIDNVLKPVLIRRGADFPILLIFAGVLGGLLAFGVIGLFVGPVILATTYTLLRDWVRAEPMGGSLEPDSGVR